MLLTLALGLFLVVATTLVHYEVLGQVSTRLPAAAVAPRLKLVVVVLVAFAAHAAEIVLYAGATWAWIAQVGVGGLAGALGSTFAACLYFSAETYTSVGFGDIVPTGPLRVLAGVETLNGLLLIGWSASYVYIAMERFWESPRPRAWLTPRGAARAPARRVPAPARPRDGSAGPRTR